MSQSQPGNETNRSPAGRKKNGIFFLLIGIPLASILMGAITLFIAFQQRDPGVDVREAPLSKTSWQQESDQ